ncbi:hypothetical protein Cni_G12578 [Canna indica]|uniref:Uncharacterized protein n=1 Tax=Canna indica TaxID=4628 RepID=A0AAQ3K840_9LILI|nr:hypothetical protein Cni_G12578 [Canna indica]
MAGRPPPPSRNLSAKNSIPRPSISPALYAIPESTPLLDSPSSFPPASPYIINHKRRGPRLLKSLLRNDASGSRQTPAAVEEKGETAAGNGVKPVTNDVHDSEIDGERKSVASTGGHGEPDSVVVEQLEGKLEDTHVDGQLVGKEELVKSYSVNTERDSDTEDFFDPQDSLSTPSNSELDRSNGSARWKPSTPSGEYFDAFDEISSDGTSRAYNGNIEEELREMRLNFVMEIERCKQAEEAIENLQNQWQLLSRHLSLVGLKLPALTTSIGEVEDQSNVDPAEELCQQIVVSRFVTDAIGRASSCAEVEIEMEPLIESKNFEIARLQDRLQYYEAANREMSQRNQEEIELVRQHRNKRKRRQKLYWCSIGVVVTLGVAALAWSHLPAFTRSSTSQSDAIKSHRE